MSLDLLSLVPTAAFLVLGVFVPGRRVARLAAFGTAASLFYGQILPVWPATIVWAVVWLGLGWFVGLEDAPSSTRAGVETGAIGLGIGLVVIALLLVAALRQNLPAAESRRVLAGLAFVGIGILHLMMRRNAVRAAASFGALGLGVHVLLQAARASAVADGLPEPLGVPLAAALAAALAIRIGRTRREVAGSAAVSDAHDLHD